MIKFNLKKNIRNTGFTLLEALVAISILMVAVTAPITIAQKGLSSAVYSKNQMVASYLAQDAIEYVKNKRDEYSIRHPILGNPDWNNLSFFSECMDTNGCQIDTIKNSTIIGGDISTYSVSSKLLLGDENSTYPGFYQYVGGAETNFNRQIKIKLDPDNESNNNKALVTVTVGWVTDSVVVKTLIFNY